MIYVLKRRPIEMLLRFTSYKYVNIREIEKSVNIHGY